MCFVRAMDSIELATFPAPELSQRIGVFPQLKIFCHNQDVISIDRKQNFILISKHGSFGQISNPMDFRKYENRKYHSLPDRLRP